MKRLSTIALILLLVVAFALPASASAATSPGIKPGGFFYFFDTTFEKIGLFFTFGPEKKAKKALEYADERLAEAEAVTDNAEAVKTAITSYESNIAFAEKKSKDVGDKEKAEALLTSIADNTSKHQEVLTAVLVKVPDEAKEAITRAIEASRKGHEEAMQKIAELKGEVEQLKQEVAELKSKDEERGKTIEELNRSKSESISKPTPTSIKPTTPQTSENTMTPKQTTTQPPTPTKAIEPKTNEPVVQPPANTTQTPEPTPPPTTQTQSSVAIQISSVNITPSLTSAQIEWQTHILTNSKIFLSGGSLSSKVYSSESGLSTRHVINITGLTSDTIYSYEIESIAGDQVAKKEGSFSTKKQVFVATQIFKSGDVPHINFYSDRPFTVKTLVFLNDDSYCQNGFIALGLEPQFVGEKAQYGLFSQIPKDSTGRFTADLLNARISFSENGRVLDKNGLHVSGGNALFRLSYGSGPAPLNTNCINEGESFTLLGSDSIIIDENGGRINLSDTVLTTHSN